MTFYDIVCFFIVYGFIGWCLEVVYCAVTMGKFVNRGVLTGTFCPIYGFGALIVIAALDPIGDNILLLFIGSVIMTSALELMTGFILDKFLHRKWWDYSDMPLNLGGYICLKFSLLWGLACVILIRVCHPVIAAVIGFVPLPVGIAVLSLLYAILLADVIITFAGLIGMRGKLKKLDELEKALHRISEGLGGNLSDTALDIRDISEEVRERGEEIGDIVGEKVNEARERGEALGDRLEAKLDDVKDDISDMLGKRREELERLRVRYNELISDSSRIYTRITKAFPNLGKTGRLGELFDNNKTDRK